MDENDHGECDSFVFVFLELTWILNLVGLRAPHSPTPDS